MALTWPQGRKRTPFNLKGHFATIGTNVVIIKYYCFNEIHIIKSK